MPVYGSIRPISELDAVNMILSVGGIAPLDSSTDHASATQTDVRIADDLMRSNLAAVQAHGWRFNLEFSHRIGVNSCGEFEKPSSLLSFSLTNRSDQQGAVSEEQSSGGYATAPTQLDLVLVSAQNVQSTDGTSGAFVFYDRILGMSSFGTTAGTTEVSSDSSGTPGSSGSRDQIFIDPVWAVNFESCPQSFRTFVTMLSARQFAQRVV
jgi:hypothetical protein